MCLEEIVSKKIRVTINETLAEHALIAHVDLSDTKTFTSITTASSKTKPRQLNNIDSFQQEFEVAHPEMKVGEILQGVMDTGYLGEVVGRDSTRAAIKQYFTHGGFYPDDRGMKVQAWILFNRLEKLQFEKWLRAGAPDERGKTGRISVLKA